MTKRLITSDSNTGLDTYHEYDPYTDETRIIYESDAQSVLDENRRLANDSEYTKKGIKQEFWKYASIPAGIQVKWLFEKGIDIRNKEHGPAIGRLLEDPEYKYLKCTTKYHKIK
jgi:hypothetical protein